MSPRARIWFNRKAFPFLFCSIVSEMYTTDHPQPIAYSNKLNMLLISRVLVNNNYYDYRYPV